MIETSMAIWWLLAGWCGVQDSTGAAKVSKVKRQLVIALTLIAGVIGGGSFFLFSPPIVESAEFVHGVASGLPAFVFARIVHDIVGAAMLGPQPEPPHH